MGCAGKRVGTLSSSVVPVGQGYEDPYKAQTCEELLKWKYAHLNSVDFRLALDKEGQLPDLYRHLAQASMSARFLGLLCPPWTSSCAPKLQCHLLS